MFMHMVIMQGIMGIMCMQINHSRCINGHSRARCGSRSLCVLLELLDHFGHSLVDEVPRLNLWNHFRRDNTPFLLCEVFHLQKLEKG